MKLIYWLKHPGMIYHRIKYWLWEKRNPDKPWLCPDTVAFCERHLTKSMRAWEFGSGRSTCWFATRVGYLTSIEHNAGWHEQVKKRLVELAITNVDYRLVPLNFPETEPERPEYDPVPDYVACCDQLENASLDFVVVDGHYRTHCVRHMVPKIKPGGFLLLDDSNLWPSLDVLQVPKNWKTVDDSTNGLKRCIIWQAA